MVLKKERTGGSHGVGDREHDLYPMVRNHCGGRRRSLGDCIHDLFHRHIDAGPGAHGLDPYHCRNGGRVHVHDNWWKSVHLHHLQDSGYEHRGHSHHDLKEEIKSGSEMDTLI